MQIRICKCNSGFFEWNIWRYLLAGEWGVTEQKKRYWWMTERWNWSLECTSQTVAAQARNDTFLSTHGCFDTLQPCTLTTPPWLINFAVFFHNQFFHSNPDTFTRASKWRVRAQTSQRNSSERHGCAMQANETPECATAFRIRLCPDSVFIQPNLKTICNQAKLGLSFKIQAKGESYWTREIHLLLTPPYLSKLMM